MSSKLTARQKEILEYISLVMLKKGTPPTLMEIGETFSISPAGVFYHLKALEKKGCITLTEGKARSIIVTDPDYTSRADIISIPLFSKMPFSDELEAMSASSSLRLSTLMIRSDKSYFAIIMDSSQMENAGIRKGDTLIFECTSEAGDNDIVAVSAGPADVNEVLIRRLLVAGGRYELIPDCDSIGAIICQTCHIYGILRALVRNYER